MAGGVGPLVEKGGIVVLGAGELRAGRHGDGVGLAAVNGGVALVGHVWPVGPSVPKGFGGGNRLVLVGLRLHARRVDPFALFHVENRVFAENRQRAGGVLAAVRLGAACLALVEFPENREAAFLSFADVSPRAWAWR